MKTFRPLPSDFNRALTFASVNRKRHIRFTAPQLRRLIVGALRSTLIPGALWLGLTACTGGTSDAGDGDFVDPYMERDSGGRRNDVTRFQNSTDLARDFINPPAYARARIVWQWPGGRISEEGIRHDLSEMWRVGIRGAVVYETGRTTLDRATPATTAAPGTGFMSPRWRELFRYACAVADSLGMEIGLNLGSGSESGGPWITPELASKRLLWSRTDVEGGRRIRIQLPLPEGVMMRPGLNVPFYIPVAVLAVRMNDAYGDQPVPTPSADPLPEAAATEPTDSAAVTEPAATPAPALLPIRPGDVYDLSERVDADGNLSWEAPAGTFRLFRFVCSGTGHRTTNASPGADGLTPDFLSVEATDVHFDHTVTVLLGEMRDRRPQSWTYITDDGQMPADADWTPALPTEFRRLNGYDLTSYLPIFAGLTIESHDATERFRADYRRTVADLLARNRYERLRELAHQRNLSIHPVVRPTAAIPADAILNASFSDVPAADFRLRTPAPLASYPTGTDVALKIATSAGHLYNRRFIAAKGPLTDGAGGGWEVDLRALKPLLDRAYLHGANRIFISAFTHSPASAGVPGIECPDGVCFNANATWWRQSRSFLTWTARNAVLLVQGKPVSDVCVICDDDQPGAREAQLRRIEEELGGRYDYDAASIDALLTRMNPSGGAILLPDGVRYRLLVLPDRRAMRPEVVAKIKELVRAGATVVAPKPLTTVGLQGYPESEARLHADADSVWGRTFTGESLFGRGRVIWGKPLDDVLSSFGVLPDFEYVGTPPIGTKLSYVHRTLGTTDIYLVVNRRDRPEWVNLTFRNGAGRRPEIWDPMTGTITPQLIFRSDRNGRISLPAFLPPHSSIFVVFRRPIEGLYFTALTRNGDDLFPKLPPYPFGQAPVTTVQSGEAFCFVTGWKYGLQKRGGHRLALRGYHTETVPIATAWNVWFDPRWGGPGELLFDRLYSWPTHPERGVRNYSGTAVYRNTFRLTAEQLHHTNIVLSLGQVFHLAEVELNGRPAGVWWSPPYEREVTSFLREGENTLEVRVTNLWPNRLIADLRESPSDRLTRTNLLGRYTGESPYTISGMLGPVRLSLRPIKRP